MGIKEVAEWAKREGKKIDIYVSVDESSQRPTYVVNVEAAGEIIEVGRHENPGGFSGVAFQRDRRILGEAKFQAQEIAQSLADAGVNVSVRDRSAKKKTYYVWESDY